MGKGACHEMQKAETSFHKKQIDSVEGCVSQYIRAVYRKSDMELNIERQRTARGAQTRRGRVQNLLLLLIEVLAVAGLLLAAVHLWQVRQALQEDLIVAEEVKAIIESGEAIPGVTEQAVDEAEKVIEASGPTDTSNAPWPAAKVRAQGQDLPALWLSARVDNDS